MTLKQQRLAFVLFGLGFLIAAVFLVMNVFREQLVFFYAPTELHEKWRRDPQSLAGAALRLGGLVQTGSVQRDMAQNTLNFVLTDGKESFPVSYRGALPALFREGQGVVAEGTLSGEGTFAATRILAKHDENYMPRDVADALKKNGTWRGGAASPAPQPGAAHAP